jgi:hypothetical protein
MPIRPFLAGQAFDPETIREMSLALEKFEPDRQISRIRLSDKTSRLTFAWSARR